MGQRHVARGQIWTWYISGSRLRVSARGMGMSELVQEFALRKRPRGSDGYP